MTLLANRTTFGIELAPVAPSWERRYLPERSAWAGLALWVEGVNLCEHTLPGSERVHPVVYVPLAPVADWLVRTWPILSCEERARLFPTTDDVFDDLRDWLDARPPAGVTGDEWVDRREEWWGRHCLQAGADGTLAERWLGPPGRSGRRCLAAGSLRGIAGAGVPGAAGNCGDRLARVRGRRSRAGLVRRREPALRRPASCTWELGRRPLRCGPRTGSIVAAFACRTRRDPKRRRAASPALIASWLGLASRAPIRPAVP